MMFKAMRERIRKYNLLMTVFLAVLATLGVLVNIRYVHSFLLGIFTSSVYIVLMGFIVGKVFLTKETSIFIRSLYGFFLLISFFIVIGVPITVVYMLSFPSFAIIIGSPLAVSVLFLFLKLRRQNPSRNGVGSDAEEATALHYVSPSYAVPLVLLAYAEFLLINSRSGWIQGTIWDVVPLSFFIVYFFAAFSIFLVIMYSRTNYTSKLILTTIFSLVSITIVAVVLYPLDIGDPIGQLGMTQLMYDYGELRTPFGLSLGPWYVYWLIKQKGLTLLTVLIAQMFAIDVYWVHTFITPVLWGVFVPLTAFSIMRMIRRNEKISIFAAFLSTFFLPFLVWGSVSTPNSAGYVVFFVSLLFSARYVKSTEKGTMTLLIALLLATASGFVHPFTGIMSFSFLFLAISLRTYNAKKVKNPRQAYVALFLSLLISLMAVQAVFGLQNALYLYFASPSVRTTYAQTDVIAFSPQNLLKTDLWELIFGEFVGFSFKELLLRATIPVLGILGLAYTLKNKNLFEKDYILFVVLTFGVCLTNYIILRYAMIHVPFGPARIWIMRDLIIIPFMAVALSSVFGFLGIGSLKKIALVSVNPTRKIVIGVSRDQLIAIVLVGLSLSAFSLHIFFTTMESRP